MMLHMCSTPSGSGSKEGPFDSIVREVDLAVGLDELWHLVTDDAELSSWLGDEVPVIGYAPSGTAWLAGKLGRAVRPARQAYLLRNHGILCCAADSDTAMAAVERLEDLARDRLAARIDERVRRAPDLRDRLATVRDLLLHLKGP